MLDELRGEPMPAGTEDEAPSKVQEQDVYKRQIRERLRESYV